MKIYEFDPLVYPDTIWIVVGTESPKEFKDLSELDKSVDAEVIYTENTKSKEHGHLIRFKNLDALNINIITHESFHVAIDIFNFIGAKINTESEECFAYLIGWIASCCETVKNNLLKEVKNENNN